MFDRRVSALLLTVFLSACGGGSETATTSTSEQAAAKAPATQSIAVTMSPSSVSASVDEGSTVTLTLTGTWRSTADPLGAKLEDSNTSFAALAPLTRTGSRSFSLQAATLASLPAGTRNGTLMVSLCRDAACIQPYGGTAGRVDYQLSVRPRPQTQLDWTAFQGSAAHTGHVPVTLDASKFRKVWEWSRPLDGILNAINPVVTGGGKVYVSTDEYHSSVALYALNEADGSQAWMQSLGRRPAMGPPSIAAGKIYVPTTGHGDTFIWQFDAASGAFIRNMPFDAQWPNLLAPTPYGDHVYTNGGYYGGGVYAFSALSGTLSWSRVAGDNDMSTPAVDAQYAYHYSGSGLEMYDRLSGATVRSIADPFAPGNTYYSYHAAPMLTGNGGVVTYSGDAFSGRASSSQEHYGQRLLVKFNTTAGTFAWATSNAYLTHPASANGVVYAARNTPRSLDAIDASTGAVLWSWAGPASDLEFHRNIVVTDNLLFVSTERAVHAVSLATRQVVWTHPEPGTIALRGGSMLYIAVGARESTGKLVAIRLD